MCNRLLVASLLAVIGLALLGSVAPPALELHAATQINPDKSGGGGPSPDDGGPPDRGGDPDDVGLDLPTPSNPEPPGSGDLPDPVKGKELASLGWLLRVLLDLTW